MNSVIQEARDEETIFHGCTGRALLLPVVGGQFNFGPPPVNGGSTNIELAAGNHLDSLDVAGMVPGTEPLGARHPAFASAPQP